MKIQIREYKIIRGIGYLLMIAFLVLKYLENQFNLKLLSETSSIIILVLILVCFIISIVFNLKN